MEDLASITRFIALLLNLVVGAYVTFTASKSEEPATRLAIGLILMGLVAHSSR